MYLLLTTKKQLTEKAGEAKVTEFYVSLSINEYVLRFDVTVDALKGDSNQTQTGVTYV